MSENLVEIQGLKKYFTTRRGVLHAVDNIDFSIKKGQTLGLVGESGCGKSTTGRVLLRLIEPNGGKILFDGQDITKLTAKQMREFRKRMQIVFQDPYASLDSRFNVYESIEEPLRIHKMYSSDAEMEKRVFELMEIVGLAPRIINSYPHELDGGRRQRVGIARALALNPELIVLDEPVSALDVSIQAQILNLLMDLQRDRGLTYLFITHDLSVVRHISDEIIVMYLGVVVERAPSRELFAHPLHPYTRELIRSIPAPDLDPAHRLVNSLRGEVSDPIDPPARCRFAPRCNHCSEACLGKNPKLTDMGGAHFVACALYETNV